MKRKPHSTSLVLLLVCIFTFWWGISVLAQRDLQTAPAVGAAQPSSPATPAVTDSAGALVVNESISGGTHTYSGTYTPRSSCNSFGSGIKYSAVNSGHVTVLLVEQPATTNCTQAAGIDTGEPFNVSIKLPAGSNPAFDGVLLNGAPITAQLVVAK